MAGDASRRRVWCWRWWRRRPRRPPSSSSSRRRSCRRAVSFVDRAGAGGSVGVPGGLAGDSGVAAQLSRAGGPASRIRVGGYLGFAASLNTALRGDLGNTLVMQVRAQRPSYWVGETFDTWRGENWTESKPGRAAPCARARRSSCRFRWATSRSGRATSRRSTSRVRPPTSSSTRRARTSCGSPPARSTSPTTAPSSRRSAWAAGPSTRSIRR